MKNNALKNTIIFVSILFVFTIIYIVLNRITNMEQPEEEYVFPLKNYEVNEYIPTYVSEHDMAKIYLNDYIYTMNSNPNKAYNLLDKEYREKKFGSLENYKTYINSLLYRNYTISKYYTKEENGYIIFGIYDNNNNLFIFKTKGVMQYTVFLDDYTVEI